MKIVPCGTERCEELISFVARLNGQAAHHIGYFGVGESEIRASLDECLIQPSEGFLLAYDHGRLIGILGVDADPGIGRAWLYGPLIEHPHWHKTADELLAVIQPLIPAGIREHELFCDSDNSRLRKFAERHAFLPRPENAVYSVSRNEYMPHGNAAARITGPWQAAFFDQFDRLHRSLFPNAYFTARQIVDRQNELHRLWIAVENGSLLGYAFCKIEIETGYVDFIGVDPAARGRGLGTDLLASSLEWMFAAPAVHKISLTVNAGNQAAHRLYEKSGFRSGRVMCGFRRQVS